MKLLPGNGDRDWGRAVLPPVGLIYSMSTVLFVPSSVAPCPLLGLLSVIDTIVTCEVRSCKTYGSL